MSSRRVPAEYAFAGSSAGRSHSSVQNVLSLRVARCDVLTKMFRSVRDEVQSIDSEHRDESARGEDDGAGEKAGLVALCRRAVDGGPFPAGRIMVRIRCPGQAAQGEAEAR